MSQTSWSAGSWQCLLRGLRPGSRTIAYRPREAAPMVDLARRGYRLMLVSSSDALIDECRSLLREQGLMSQLMGSFRLTSDRPLSLAKGFYELVLCFEPLGQGLDGIAPYLAPGGTVVLAQGGDVPAEPNARFDELTALPTDYRGYRLK